MVPTDALKYTEISLYIQQTATCLSHSCGQHGTYYCTYTYGLVWYFCSL